MIDPLLSAPNVQLAADSTKVVTERRDAGNVVTQLFAGQLPTIKNGFFNIKMTKGIIVQPHWHPNATEMVVVIEGEVLVSVFDPFTRRLLSYRLGPNQVAVLPQGWFHWIIAESDTAKLLAIFDQPTPDVVFGSDFLGQLPAEVVQRAYGIDAAQYAATVAPLAVNESPPTIFGPPLT